MAPGKEGDMQGMEVLPDEAGTVRTMAVNMKLGKFQFHPIHTDWLVAWKGPEFSSHGSLAGSSSTFVSLLNEVPDSTVRNKGGVAGVGADLETRFRSF